MQIWKEIAYIQKEITMAKKVQRKVSQGCCVVQVLPIILKMYDVTDVIEMKWLSFHAQTADLHCRLQWLEQRLERLLLAQRRARPAARGRRAVPPRVSCFDNLLQYAALNLQQQKV